MCKDVVARSKALSDDLLRQADEMAKTCDHDGGLMLEGVIRDCALKIRGAIRAFKEELEREGSSSC